jgi:hypothetical protein
MGCGVIGAARSKENHARVIDERNHSASQSNLLIRYETSSNVYKIKLTPPKSGK